MIFPYSLPRTRKEIEFRVELKAQHPHCISIASKLNSSKKL